MHKDIFFMGFFIGLLLLAPAAFALSYSASAQLNLSSLTFSGVPFSLTPGFPRDPRDPSRGNFEAQTRTTSLSLPGGPSQGHSVLFANLGGREIYGTSSVTRHRHHPGE
jgi:hypothetical protein